MSLVNRDVSVSQSVAVGGVHEAPPRERKWAISYYSIEVFAIAIDALAIFMASILSGVIYHRLTIGSYGDIFQFVGSAAAVSALFIALARNQELYKPTKLISFKSQLRSIVLLWLGVILFCAGVVFALKIGKEFSRGATLSFAASGIIALGALRIFWRLSIERGLARSKFAGRSAVLIADPVSFAGSEIQYLLRQHGYNLERQFVLPLDPGDSQGYEVLVRQVTSYVRGSHIEEIIVGADADRWMGLETLFSDLRRLPLPVNLVPVGSASRILALPSQMIGDTFAIEVQRGPLSALERASKRAIDIVFAAAGLIALLPLLMIVAFAIQLDSPGPILFRQRRSGFNGRQFHILKFRTMTVLEDGDSIAQAARDDCRITRVGWWLRRTSIDELPQLLNVLSGTMSIVGPRPHAVAHDNQFNRLVENYALRHHVKPGLTGWAQVNGYRGETRTAADIERRVKLDLWYIDNWSFALDLVIVFRTAIEVMRAKNAY
jgi:Undecaprenyl-phosphate glucose phosphotransferase